MNAMTRTFNLHHTAIRLPAFPLVGRPVLRNSILLVMILITALGIVYTKDINRRLFIQYQSMQQGHEQQYETWGKLLLEQSTLSQPARVEQIASTRLQMMHPDPKKVVVIDAQS